MSTTRLYQTNKIGVRELKQRLSEIMRRVREDNEAFDVTYRGRVVASIVPASNESIDKAKASSVWGEMDELAQEIGALWPPDVSAVEAVQKQRREL